MIKYLMLKNNNNYNKDSVCIIYKRLFKYKIN